MKELNLNDLLRYGFAGAVFFLIAALAFRQPAEFLFNKDLSGSLAAASTAAALSVGCVIYALHRAVVYPLFYVVFKVLAGRRESMLELDIRRWKNTLLNNSLQPRLFDWAAQVHFLYCIAWSSLTALLLGHAACWDQTSMHAVCWYAPGAFVAAAMWHHLRYQQWERRVFAEDARVEQATHAKSASGTNDG